MANTVDSEASLPSTLLVSPPESIPDGQKSTPGAFANPTPSLGEVPDPPAQTQPACDRDYEIKRRKRVRSVARVEITSWDWLVAMFCCSRDRKSTRRHTHNRGLSERDAVHRRADLELHRKEKDRQAVVATRSMAATSHEDAEAKGVVISPE